MLELILSITTLIALIIAARCDIRKREVPDWLNYGFMFAVLGIRAIFSLEQGWEIIVSGIIGFAIFFAIGYFFYHFNQWGGGDAKLLMGLGASIGVTIPLDNSSFNLFWFFLAMLLLGAVYGLTWMFYLAIRERKKVFSDFKETIKEHKLIHLILMVLSAGFVGLSFVSTLFWPLAVFPLCFFYLFLLVNIVEKNCFFKLVSPAKLTEGDWLAEKVKINRKVIVDKKTLEQSDILKLRELLKKRKIRSVLIKEGIPFIPSFLMAYIVVLLGNKWW